MTDKDAERIILDAHGTLEGKAGFHFLAKWREARDIIRVLREELARLTCTKK